MAERLQAGNRVNPHQLGVVQGGEGNRPPQPGVGGNQGGINPPPAENGVMDLVLDVAIMVRDFLRALHKVIFFCQPVKNDPVGNQRNDQALDRFLRKWFPETIEFLPGDSKEVMIQELGKLAPEDFKLIVRAFNEATRQVLDEDTTTPEILIRDRLVAKVTLKKELFADRPELIRPYGLHQENLKHDLERLPGLQEALQAYAGEERLHVYFSSRMGMLKGILIALRGV